MSDLLRKAVIRLAHSKPELRGELLPLLKEADGKGEDEGRAPNQEEKSQIRDFISQPGIKDKDFHEWLGKKGINPHKAEDEVYAYVRELKTAARPHGRHPLLDSRSKFDDSGYKRREQVPSNILHESFREGLERLVETARRLNHRHLFGFANLVKSRKWEDAMHFYSKLDQKAKLEIPPVVMDEFRIKTVDL